MADFTLEVILTLRFTSPWAVRSLAAAENFLRGPARPSRTGPRALWVRALGAAGSALMLCSATADVAPALLPPIPQLVFQPDPRAERLERFFRTYHCPAPYFIAEYLRAADDYELDYRLLPAVSLRETLCGVGEQGNNRWGYHNGRQSFPSVEAGIDFVARRLAQSSYYKGKTLPAKLFTYNPRPAYPTEVQRIMLQIAPQ